LNAGCDVFAEAPKLVANLGRGLGADGAALALPVGGVAEGYGANPARVGLVEVDAVVAMAARRLAAMDGF
jgi:hypothetical protein